MTALGAARYIERAGALALAVAMSAQPAVAHAGRGQRAAITPTGVGLLPRIGTKMPAGSAHDSEEMSAPDPAPASGGLVGAISALLVALRRRPSSSTSSRSAPGLSLIELLRSLFGLPDRSLATTPAPVTPSSVVNATAPPEQPVAG